MPSLDRRHLLRQLAWASAAASVGVVPGCKRRDYDEATLEDLPSFTRQRAPHYFVFYFLMGGWDLVSLTEPRPKSDQVSVPYRPDEVFEVGGHRLGPAMKPLRPFMDQMGILRGLRATALNHPQARFQLVTGRFREPGQAPAASIQTRLGDLIGRGYPIPNLSSDGLRPATFLGDYDPHLEPLRVGDMWELRGLSRPRGPVRDHEDIVTAAIRKRDAAFAERHPDSPLVADFAENAELARQVAESDFRRRAQDFKKMQFEPTKRLSKSSKQARQAHLAVETIRNDLAPIITVGSGEFDAHNSFDYRTHHDALARATETIAAICSGLAGHTTADGDTLLDRTTVVVTSEFSRQPWINELGGKHHWDANSVLFIGKGVRGTKGGLTMVGECDDNLFPQPLNPVSGKPDDGADTVTNAHFLATVMAMAGIDPGAHFSAPPIQALIA